MSTNPEPYTKEYGDQIIGDLCAQHITYALAMYLYSLEVRIAKLEGREVYEPEREQP